jgi:hypothetical protein
MAFCPKCRFEYRTAISHCPDCGAALVAELLPEEEARRRDLGDAVLCRASGELKAVLIRNELAAEGIPSRVQATDVSPLSGVPMLPPADTFTIFVLRKDLSRARIVCEDLERSAQIIRTPDQKIDD